MYRKKGRLPEGEMLMNKNLTAKAELLLYKILIHIKDRLLLM